MVTRQHLLYLVISVLVMLPACSSGDKAPQGINAGIKPGESFVQFFPGQDELRFRSTITFERLRAVSDPAGLTPRAARDTAPARFVDVVALSAVTSAEIQITPCSTGADGSFELVVPRGIPFRVAVLASTRNSGGRVNLELRDPTTNQRMAVAIGDPTGAPFSFDTRFATAQIELPPISVSPNSSPPSVTDRPASAFHILDTCVTAAEEVRAALGISLPLLTIFWAADSTLGSFFLEQADPFGPSLFVLGGDAFIDNIDDFDASVITHEFGHFVAFAALHDSSLGGSHGASDVVYPSLAFSEGFANAFSGMVLNQAAYVDAAFVLTTPDFFLVNLENRTNSIPVGSIGNQRGIRSEFTVGELAWDIVDGTGGRVSSDGDGVSVEFGAYLRALASLRNRPVYVSVNDALQALTDTGAAPQAALTTLLTAPENQQLTFPPAGADVFPTRLNVPDVRVDTCQTRGNIDSQNSSLDVSNRYFQFTLAAQTAVTVRMTLLFPTLDGTGASSENIDMFVRNTDNTFARDVNGVQLTQNPGPEALVETTGSRILAPGTYVVEVRGRTTDATGAFSNSSGGNDIPYRREVTSP